MHSSTSASMTCDKAKDRNSVSRLKRLNDDEICNDKINRVEGRKYSQVRFPLTFV